MGAYQNYTTLQGWVKNFASNKVPDQSHAAAESARKGIRQEVEGQK